MTVISLDLVIGEDVDEMVNDVIEGLFLMLMVPTSILSDDFNSDLSLVIDSNVAARDTIWNGNRNWN